MFALVFGFSVVFSSVVSADDIIISHEDRSSKPDLVNGTTFDYEYFPSTVSQGSYLFDTFNANVPSDLGYHTYWQYVQRSSSFFDYYQHIVMPGLGCWNTDSESTASISRSGFFSSSGGPWIWNYEFSGLMKSFSLGMNQGNNVTLKAGEKYLFNCKIVAASSYNPNSFTLTGGDINILDTYVNDTNNFYVLFVPNSNVSTTDIRFNAKGFNTEFTSSFQVWSFGFSNVTDTDSIEEAIRDQTNDMNQNHDETMDKIDDVTDFDDQEQSDLTGAVDGASDQINEKLGILSFGDHVLDQFISIFDAAGSPGITLPGFSIEVDGVQHVVWTDQVFDLSTIEDKFGPLMTAVHFATSFLVYAALVMYVQKIFGAIMQDWGDK